MRTGLVAILAVFLLGESAVAQPTPIGEWRDYLGRFWDMRMQIVEEDGEFVLTIEPKGAASARRELVEVKPLPGERRRFSDRESDEAYAIDASTGDLELHDSNGLIRTAKKVD